MTAAQRLGRRVAPAAVLVVVAVAASSWSPDSAGAAKRPACKKGQAVFKLEGKARCVKAPKVRVPATPGSRADLIASRLLRKATQPLPKGRSTRLTRGMRRLLTRRSRNGILTAVRRTESLVRSSASAARAKARTAQTVQRVQGGSFTQRSGRTTMTGTASATVSDAGQAVIDIGLRLAEGKASTEMKVSVEFEATDDSRLCPDATGKVVLERRSGGSLTTLVRKGGNVESAETTRSRTVTETVGQVGPDGLLSSVRSEQRTTTTVFRRGMQLQITTTRAVRGAPDAPGRATGTPTVDASVRADGLSAAEARQVERDIAAKAASDQTDATIEASVSDTGRDDLRKAAKNWESASDSGSNPCLKVVFSPPTALLKPGQSTGVTATLSLVKDGTPVPATWSIVYVGTGQFTGGPGGAFTATGGESATEYTVAASVVATSVAGRVRGNWDARRHPSYKVVFTSAQTANTATHDATATLSGTLFTVPQEGSDPQTSTASGPVDWSNIVFTPKIGCSYQDPVSGGTWGVTITDQPGDTIRVTWTADNATRVTASVACPGAPAIPGQPGPRPLGVEPVSFVLPATGGTQRLTGSVTSDDGGFFTDGTIVVTPND
jgi:hypothetical protein